MYNKSFMQMAIGLSMLTGMAPLDLESQVEKSIFGGASSELGEHLVRNKRTLQEEYELIQQKKSSLSSRMRDYVEYLYAKRLKAREEGENKL
jgi:hypothetical protein